MISQFLWVNNLGMAYLGSGVSWSLMRLQSKRFSELQSFEGLTGAEGPISTVTHSRAVGRRLELLATWAFLQGCWRVLTTWQLAPSRLNYPRRWGRRKDAAMLL